LNRDQKTQNPLSYANKTTSFLVIFIIEGLIAFNLLAAIPSDREAGVMFGFSTSRLVLLAAHAVILLFLVYLLLFDRRCRFSLQKKLLSFSSPHSEKWSAISAFLLMSATFLPLQILLSVYHTTGSYREYAYFQRLLPTLGWLFFIGLQLLLWILLKNRSTVVGLFTKNRPALIPAAVIFFVFLAAALFAAITGIGLKPDKYGWGAPGVPLMEWQIWFSILFGFLVTGIIGGSLYSGSPLSRKDLFICIGVWIAAVLIWGTQPVPPGFFATPGRLPNFEIYPFSDGAFYDFYAQNIVIGNGFRGPQIPPRPLYILFLAIAHFIVGQDYNLVVLIQTFLLALIPVAIYLLGRAMHSTTAGLAAASMAILRELTTILSTPFTDDVSNSKLLFADLPSTLGIALLLLCVFLWLRNPWKRNSLQMASGLAMGILLLVRTQSLLLLPVIFLVALVLYRKKLLQFTLDFGLFTLVMAICISPWLSRNYSIAGAFIFDHPESQSRVMAQRYDFDGDFDSHERRPGEGTGAYSNRLTAAIQQTIIQHPLYVAEFVGGHFLNNEIDDLLILPIRNGLSGPRELLFPTQPFWQEWNGQISWSQALLLAANLLVISLGIGVSWKKYKILGLFPLFINLTYNLSTAVARYSGWRYLLPVDWILYFYFAIGIVSIVSLLVRHYGKNKDLLPVETPASDDTARHIPLLFPPIRPSMTILLLAFVIGFSLILAEMVIPARYSLAEKNQILPEMLANPVVKSSGIDLEALSLLQSHPNAFIVRGRALYPRYYAAGEGEAKTAKTGYEPSPDARLVFMVASNPDGLTIFRTDTSPEYFPNGADVSVVGCQHQLYAEAWIITIHGEKEVTYISPDAAAKECRE
jgi:4-amino-4-deoxy-L-arabinose transferase-like glycosyltransferase